jgi:hypothetical protein
MAHFAQLDANNIVLDVIVINNAVVEDLPFPESEPLGVAFCRSLYGADTLWKQTSYNGNFRKYYAAIGFAYDPTSDEFIPPPSLPLSVDMATIQARVGDLNFQQLSEEELP